MPNQIVTVFGGTGFLGSRIVRRLTEEGWVARIAARHPPQDGALGRVPFAATDVGSEAAVSASLVGAYAAINAVSLYRERGEHTFAGVHVAAAERVARAARAQGLERLVHVSGIGADAASSSPYIRSRGQGERVVRVAFPDVAIVRPAVMFGHNDALIATLARLVRLPAIPMFGSGATRLQPACVDDVATAIVRCLGPQSPRAATYELGGPKIYTYAELLRAIAARLGRRPLLLPLPFAVWDAVARIAEVLPAAPLTRGQVALMQHDSIVSAALPGFSALGIAPQSLERALEALEG